MSTDARFRIASACEAAYYEERLYPLQDRILALVGETYGDRLVLTGGTALARLYLDHRFSDDLDLFTLAPAAGRLGADLGNTLTAAGLRVDPVTASPEFYRAMISDGTTQIQLDVAPDQPRLDTPRLSELNVYAHTLREIAANKIGAFENRSEVKDAVDLFYLAEQFAWSDVFCDAETKRVPIAYEDLKHLRDQPLQGQALLRAPIAADAFAAFLESLHREIELEVKKKVSEYALQIDRIVFDLLWDTPPDRRTINETTAGVLEQRLTQLPLPQRLALAKALHVGAPLGPASKW